MVFFRFRKVLGAEKQKNCEDTIITTITPTATTILTITYNNKTVCEK